ncbi:MAG: alpha/beta fold hydrolase [Candidatus Thermoplasmatota archaeon]|nr:alpha/beta fold hydrolase [Candidatus Thermoplasmatota archaeon]
MLYYIHGYLSSPKSTKGALFSRHLKAKAISYRKGKPEDLVIADCLHRIAREIAHDSEVTLIGSSLGGFLAAKTALLYPQVQRLVLLNPAVIPPTVDIKSLTGMPVRILRDMQDPQLFQQKVKADVVLLLGTMDDVVPNAWGWEFAQVQDALVKFLHDDHRFSHHLEELPTILSPYV